MSIDRSKYIYYAGQLLPIDYILVYTRYHSNHFRRSHRFKRQHDEYREFFQDRLRKLGFIVVEERLTDEVNKSILNFLLKIFHSNRKMIFSIYVKPKHQQIFMIIILMKVIMHLFVVYQLYNDMYPFVFKQSVHI
jgi:hypothetical protein